MSLFTPQALNWLSKVLEERFGYKFILMHESQGLKLILRGSEQEGSIIFPMLESAFHESRSDFPCAQWDAEAEGLQSILNKPLPMPCVDELPQPLIEIKQDHAVINYDILGLTYWMLNRIEEIGRTDLDRHQRFPAVNSHAYKHNYLERPIVDEWLYILGQVMQRVWSELELKQHEYSMKVSHDVDAPSRYGFRSAKAMLRGMLGDLLIRKDFKSVLIAPWLRLTTKNKIHYKDPFNTFNWIMDQSDKVGLTSAFYFICGRTDLNKDADYEIEHPAIRKLMKNMHRRGHEIGLHPSYNSYLNPEDILNESVRLKDVMKKEGISQENIGGRMHYLRWSHPQTLQSWNDAGMKYDSTLGYADRPGFRCGTCFEYPAFNTVSQELLSIRIRPLVVMECSVISEEYLGLGISSEATDKFLYFKSICKKNRGVFTLLWHNSSLVSSAEKSMYTKIVLHQD